MNRCAIYLISLWILADAASAAVPRQVTKTSREQLHIERELLDFFDHLREQDAEGQRELRAVIEPLKIPERELDIVRVPTVNLWYPSSQRLAAGGIVSADSTYLLVLPVGSTRDHAEESVSGCVLAEFHVTYKAQRKPTRTLTSNTLTITFRGFRLSRS